MTLFWIQNAWYLFKIIISAKVIGSHELTSVETNFCPKDSYFCDDNECIPMNLTCNGIAECSNGKDESVWDCGCLPNEFLCNETCIDAILRCDTRQDCTDGSDEEDCETFACPYTHFKCNNHFCIPGDSVCDFINDCGDSSDEQNCLHRACWFGEFTCNNGQCIQAALLCDGNSDCLDGSDENQCDLERDHVQCGDKSLVHRYFWCDNWPDCKDNHADELNCKNCSIDEFQCSNTRCVKFANVCDMICDCAYTCEDEVNCSGQYEVINSIPLCDSITTYLCPNSERCIHKTFLCDGRNDCQSNGDSSDEYGCKWYNCSSNSIHCADGRCLPAFVRCDFVKDCVDGADEMGCDFLNCTEGEFSCSNGQCIKENLKCDTIYDCYDRSDETDCHSSVCPLGFYQCLTGQCIPSEWHCDYHKDCPDESDEIGCEWNKKKCIDTEFQCNNGQCISKELVCYETRNNRIGCEDGSHLLNCRNWTCPSHLHKCLNSYCINKSRICNGQVDCWGSWNDEIGCAFQCSSEKQCECRDITINCTNIGLKVIPDDIEREISKFIFSGNKLNNNLNENMFEKLDRIHLLDLSNNSIDIIWPRTFKYLWRLRILYLHGNSIEKICNGSFFGLSNVATLNLKNNQIKSLEPLSFYGLTSLKLLDLSEQQLENISVNAFLGLRNLLKLNLSHNRLTYLSDGTLNGLPQLLSLDLTKNCIKIMGSNIFRSLPLMQHLLTDEFRFCCLARHVLNCFPQADEFSSCEDLMSNLVLRVCIWILGFIAFIGNILVIVWRLTYKINYRIHSFLITNLAIADMCMGVYLLIIAAVDARYRGVYFIYDSLWRTSTLCQFSGFLSTFSSELSVFTLTVITLHRFIGIAFPFQFQQLQMNQTRIVIILLWVIVAVLAGLPLLDVDYFKYFYGRSGVCLALHITSEKPNGWEYSVFIFLVLNLMSFAAISAAYIWMFLVAKNSQRAFRSQETNLDKTMARRMSLIVFTDFCCWMPIIILGFISLSKVNIPPQVFAWIAVFILPLNAAINPVLYTLSTSSFIKPASKQAWPATPNVSNVETSKTALTNTIGSPYKSKSNHTKVDYLNLNVKVGDAELVPLKDLNTNDEAHRNSFKRFNTSLSKDISNPLYD